VLFLYIGFCYMYNTNWHYHWLEHFCMKTSIHFYFSLYIPLFFIIVFFSIFISLTIFSCTLNYKYIQTNKFFSEILMHLKYIQFIYDVIIQTSVSWIINYKAKIRNILCFWKTVLSFHCYFPRYKFNFFGIFSWYDAYYKLLNNTIQYNNN